MTTLRLLEKTLLGEATTQEKEQTLDIIYKSYNSYAYPHIRAYLVRNNLDLYFNRHGSKKT